MKETTMIANALNNAKENAKKDLKKKEKVIGIQYNPKKVKVVFSKEMTLNLSSYYAVKTQLFKVARVYSNNIKVFQKRFDNIMKKEKLSQSDNELLESTQRDILRSQVCYKYFKSKINSELKPSLDMIKDELYDAYVNRFINNQEWENAIVDILKENNMKADKTLIDFIDKNFGSRSMAISKLDKGIIDNLSKGAFKKLFLDVLLQLAIDKDTLSKVVVEQALTEEVLDIEEFKEMIIVDKPTPKTTIKEYKEIFDMVGVDYKGMKKKEEFFNVYKKALRNKLFTEM